MKIIRTLALCLTLAGAALAGTKAITMPDLLKKIDAIKAQDVTDARRASLYSELNGTDKRDVWPLKVACTGTLTVLRPTLYSTARRWHIEALLVSVDYPRAEGAQWSQSVIFYVDGTDAQRKRAADTWEIGDTLSWTFMARVDAEGYVRPQSELLNYKDVGHEPKPKPKPDEAQDDEESGS